MEEYAKLIGIDRELPSYKILLVGAGGIGCELLKSLVFSGFTSIHIIDLDTIEVSNLNRQFLFRPHHVGMSKALVAKESVEKLYGKPTTLHAYYDDITKREYDSSFYKQFYIVLCALDNVAARIHINRMCLRSSVPFIDSGTAGYLGNLNLISMGETACYECKPNKSTKTYASCTIRNTPSKPIHCVVWAKYLFNQLFSKEDLNEDISPENVSIQSGENSNGPISIKKMAENCDYDVEKLLFKLFYTDINYLLSLGDLWKGRKPPTPIGEFSFINGHVEACNYLVWSLEESISVFNKSMGILKVRLYEKGEIGWDKDDEDCINFVTAASNIRSHVFSIEKLSKFTAKSLAGNIIPAIAFTNATIAGLVVIELIKFISDPQKCRSIYLSRYPTSNGCIIVPTSLPKPNRDCYACSESNIATVLLDLDSVTVGFFRDKILKEGLGMVFPDVEIDDGSGTILISCDLDEDDQKEIDGKLMTCFNIMDSSELICDDFFQDFKIIVKLQHSIRMGDDFHIVRSDEDVVDFARKRLSTPIPESSSKRSFIDNVD